MKDTWDLFINDLIGIEDRAHRLGLHATAHAINEAKKKAGYERGDQLVRNAAALAKAERARARRR